MGKKAGRWGGGPGGYFDREERRAKIEEGLTAFWAAFDRSDRNRKRASSLGQKKN